MNKSKINNNKVQSPIKQQSTSNHTKGSFLRSIKWPVIIVLGVLIIVYVLWPKITIIPGENINPRDPFNTAFIIENNSIYPIHEIKTECNIDSIEDNNHHIFNKLTANIDTGYIEKLGPLNSRQIIFKIIIKGLEKGVTRADINFLLSYKLPLISLNISKTIPLTVMKTLEDTYEWSVLH